MFRFHSENQYKIILWNYNNLVATFEIEDDIIVVKSTNSLSQENIIILSILDKFQKYNIFGIYIWICKSLKHWIVKIVEYGEKFILINKDK